MRITEILHKELRRARVEDELIDDIVITGQAHRKLEEENSLTHLTFGVLCLFCGVKVVVIEDDDMSSMYVEYVISVGKHVIYIR